MKDALTRGAVLLASILAFALPASVQAGAADGFDPASVRPLLEAQKNDQAYAALLPRVSALAGDPAFDYYYGIAALRSGHAVEAILAFERLVDVRPDDAEARAYLARAYFEAGENATAKAEFEQVLNTGHTLPDQVTHEIERYLSAIETRLDRDAARYALFFETAAGYDSNVNNATDQRAVAVPALGGVQVDLAPGSRASESGLFSAAGGGGFAARLAQDWTLIGSGSLRQRLALDAAQFRQFTARADLGLEWALDGVNTLRLVAGAERFDVGGERNRDLGGLTLQWQHALAARTLVSVFAQGALHRYPDQSFRDVDRYVGGAGLVHRFQSAGDLLLYGSVYAGAEDATRSGADRVSRTLAGVRVGGERTLGPHWTAFASADYQHSDFDGAEPLFGRARLEDYAAIVAGARYRVQDGWTLTPQVTWARNDSNIDLYAYERVEALLTLRNDF